MKNRTLPYGYCCKDGVIVTEPRESKVLKRIFAAYLDGSSMLTIAEQLNREKIEYRDGVTGWNKGRLKHLIDNTKYLGTEVYPPIIDQETYEKIQKTKHGRNTQRNTDKAQDIFKLTVPVRCPSCGDRMRRRHDSRCKCQERWTCENTACRLRIEIPDAELLTVNGETIDAEEYLYWLAYDCEYLAYNVQDLDFDAELSEGMTYGAYAKQDALETVKLYAVVRQWAKRGNVTLSDADREALENQRQQYITYYGSQEAYSKQIQGMGVSEAMFDAISRGYYLYAGVRQAFCTPGSALYPAQEDIDALARQKGYATSLLLYWPLDGQDDDNTRLAAESFAQQLRDAQDVTAAYLDLAGQLGMEDVTEAGVTASAGDMGETLAAAVSALEPGQVSDVIDTGSALYVAVGKELDQSAVVNALFETQIKAAVADAGGIQHPPVQQAGPRRLLYQAPGGPFGSLLRKTVC